jgi:group II intron reverse transcriptase/maturase
MICDPSLLYLAYDNIKSKPGNMTPGIVPTTLDGMSLEEFNKLSELLKKESFNFQPGRRVQIPKPGKKGSRPLTIAPARDKIVQEAMRIVLEAIFEPTFLDSSHGFRPNRSCHSAWYQIYRDFKSVSWVIEGDIQKCFDSIDHSKLMVVVEGKIRDRQFTKLIWKSLKAGYFEFKVENNLIGTPQGSIISPLLANVFLHQLDVYVESLKEGFDIGNKIRVSPEYTKIRHQKRKAGKANDIPLVKSLHNSLMRTDYTLFNDPNYKRLHYVRYADDWIIGIRGSKEDAERLKDLIKDYLMGLGLTLSLDKTKISNMSEDYIKFLGICMIRQSHVKFFGSPNKNHVIQRTSQKMRIEAPLDDIRKKLHTVGILKHNRPYPRNIWKGYTHKQILILYNSILRGYLNYYSFVHNHSRLSTYLYWVLKGSCGMLLASKFSLGTVSAALKKFGKDLSFKEQKVIKPKKKAEQEEMETVETIFYKPDSFAVKYMNFKLNKNSQVISLAKQP